MLGLLSLGYMNPEIADRLVLSVRTVETHRANIQRKTGLSTRAELVAYASRTTSSNADGPPRRSALVARLRVVGEQLAMPFVWP